MCGIFGSYGINDLSLLKRATSKLIHRGPDSEGYYTDSEVMLGIRRLKIIDLKKGDQPSYNEDSSVVVAFNGEIYNYLELKSELEKKGHRFKTESDTEVIAHAYEEYGEDAPKKFNGMFAFAIWDSIKKKLMLCRDRYGVKPLYYWKEGSTLLFSSEIKALLEYTGIKRALNVKELPHYLKYRFIKGPETFIKGIKKLMPGFLAVISESGFYEKKYYSLPEEKQNERLADAAQRVRLLLEDSVKKRLIADVPVGIFLSGGIDSSALLACMRHLDRDREIKSFTVGFEDDISKEEFRYASMVSEEFGTEHHEYLFAQRDAAKSIEKVIYHLEEPIADATAIPTFLLSQAASKKIKVALSGEGADEAFRGYVYYDSLEKYSLIAKMPPFFRKPAAAAIGLLPERLLSTQFSYPGGIGEAGKKRLIELIKEGANLDKAYDSLISLNDSKDIKEATGKKWPAEDKKENIAKEKIYQNIFRKDMSGWLPDYILPRVDKMTMASSIECRTPFLDYRLVDYLAKMKKPELLKNKSLLRKAMSGSISEPIIKRKKIPFHIPINSWQAGEFKDAIDGIISSSDLVGDKIINKEYSERLINDSRSPGIINSRRSWSFAALEMCYRKFCLSD